MICLGEVDLNRLSPSEKRKLLRLLQQQERLSQYGGHLIKLFPDEGPLRYENYPKHLEFFKAGAVFKERLFMAANRIGKTLTGAYELACHLTGCYPHWWQGRVFTKPITAWGAGKTGQTTRDVIQNALLGPNSNMGSGLIAKDRILSYKVKPGIPNAIDSAEIRHKSGEVSYLGFKSYDQGRQSFEGVQRDVIWLDEEMPIDIYGEALVRTMTTNGIIYVTFTPLQGLTEFVTDFMENAVSTTEEGELTQPSIVSFGDVKRIPA